MTPPRSAPADPTMPDPAPAAPLAPPSTTSLVVTSIATWLLPILAVCGLLALIGLGKLSADVGLPLVGTLVGAHVGVQASNS